MPTRKFSIGNSIGASMPAGTYPIVVFVPSVDRDGIPLDGKFWVRETLHTLGRLFRGATALPGSGVWRDDEGSGRLIDEDSVVVFCLADPAEVTAAAARDLRRFLHRMGREARQGEVGAVLEGKYWGITRFDADEK